ncbi:hypothetical protein PMAYCL1PPCAC_17147 [Pristionchus mayeri]|uniref:Uncharacterized protein n=1 Tax=Pristionchus mayeri TaxID=1317129 RepID=A0AAN5CM41_9BILA|nr:hypothetical protein PMAYCL1PPCAC_17147 [Pristionchus mayeri]
MVYQHPMFTHRICCCSATVASQVMACIAIVLCAIVAVSNWIYDTPLYLEIYQKYEYFGTILVVTEIFACFLVFVACYKIRPSFVLPIIVIQIWNSISIVGTGIWIIIYLWDGLDSWDIVNIICEYAFSLLISLFVLHCHVCCFKLLSFMGVSAHHHHCGPPHYYA